MGKIRGKSRGIDAKVRVQELSPSPLETESIENNLPSLTAEDLRQQLDHISKDVESDAFFAIFGTLQSVPNPGLYLKSSDGRGLPLF